MIRLGHQSLLVQLLCSYLLFVLIVLLGTATHLTGVSRTLRLTAR